MTETLPKVNPEPPLEPLSKLPPLHAKWLAEGHRLFRRIPLSYWGGEHRFFGHYQKHKLDWVSRGWSVAKVNEIWHAQQWLTPEFRLTPTGAEILKRLAPTQGELGLKSEPELGELPPLPHGLEEKLFAYQRQPARQLFRAVTHGLREWGYPGAVDLSDLGCHAYGQLILMADGSMKQVQDINVGDRVMGWKGPQTVTELKRGFGAMAEIIPVKGASFVVNLDHILTMVNINEGPSRNSRHSNQIYDISVADYLNLPKSRQAKLLLMRSEQIECWPDQNLPVDPYFLGLILGDGCLRHGMGGLSVSKPDEEIAEEVKRQCAYWGGDYACVHRSPNGTNPSHWMRSAHKLTAVLDGLGLMGTTSHDKFVPMQYLTAGASQRAALLAGLLDTDGHLCKGNCYDYISASWQLAYDVAFLARSLGLAAYLKPCTKGCQNGHVGDYWRVSISGDCDKLPLRIPRKQAAPRLQKKSALRTGFRVELLPEDGFYGFSLDGDGRFLLGDFTVTHNTGKTYQSLAAAIATGRKIIVLCPTVGRAGWLRAFAHFGAEPHAIETYEAVRGGWRPSIVQQHRDGRFEWLNADQILLILDEAQALRHDETLNVRCCAAAVRPSRSSSRARR
jgi:hypothetical protein